MRSISVAGASSWRTLEDPCLGPFFRLSRSKCACSILGQAPPGEPRLNPARTEPRPPGLSKKTPAPPFPRWDSGQVGPPRVKPRGHRGLLLGGCGIGLFALCGEL